MTLQLKHVSAYQHVCLSLVPPISSVFVFFLAHHSIRSRVIYSSCLVRVSSLTGVPLLTDWPVRIPSLSVCLSLRRSPFSSCGRFPFFHCPLVDLCVFPSPVFPTGRPVYMKVNISTSRSLYGHTHTYTYVYVYLWPTHNHTPAHARTYTNIPTHTHAYTHTLS